MSGPGRDGRGGEVVLAAAPRHTQRHIPRHLRPRVYESTWRRRRRRVLFAAAAAGGLGLVVALVLAFH